MKKPVKSVIDMMDDSMAPVINKGDIINITTGYEVSPEHYAAFFLNNGENAGSQLLIRSVELYGNGIALRPINPQYPTLLFEGDALHRLLFIGIVSKITTRNGANRGNIVTANRAPCNGLILEKHHNRSKRDYRA